MRHRWTFFRAHYRKKGGLDPSADTALSNESGGVLRVITLLSIFVLAFLASLALFFGSSFFMEPDTTTVVEGSTGEGAVPIVDEQFPLAAAIRTAGDFIAIEHSEKLIPSTGEDFVLFSWIKPRRLPKETAETIFLAKLEGDRAAAKGFSLGLVQTGSVVRPTFYWRNGQGVGGGFLFSELALKSKEWLFLAVGVVQNKLITLYSASPDGSGSYALQFHGSHELEEEVIPATSSDFLIGSKRSGNFRGHLGPFGIISGTELGEEFKEIFEELLEDPFSIPEAVEPSDVRLFVAETTQDISSFNHPVKVRGIGEFSEKKKGKGK